MKILLSGMVLFSLQALATIPDNVDCYRKDSNVICSSLSGINENQQEVRLTTCYQDVTFATRDGDSVSTKIEALSQLLDPIGALKEAKSAVINQLTPFSVCF